MAVWKKVIVSGSTANLAALQVDNLNSGEVVIGGGQAANLSTRIISGSGAILASGGSNIQLSGSFSGSFFGNGAGLTGVTAQSAFALTLGEGIGSLGPGISGSYNGNQPVTIVVSGAVDLTDGRHVKWDNGAGKFVNSLIFDDGTNVQITGSTINVSASSALIVTGSVRASAGFTGSLLGTSSWASNVINAQTASFVNNLNQNVVITGSVVVSGSAATELFVLGDQQITGSLRITNGIVAQTITGSFTGSLTGALTGTSSWATNATTATQVANALTPGSGLSGTAGTYNGSAPVTFNVGAGALIAVNADDVQVNTSSLSTNQIPKFSANALAGSNISDTGTQVQIGASATSGLSIAAGGIDVTGNSVFRGNITVAGTASFTNTDSLFVADKFIALSSGSATVSDSGLLIVTSTSGGNMSGSAFYLEGTTDASPNYGRFAVAANIHATASAATADEYMVSVKIAQGSNPSAAPTWGGATQGTGNMWITNAGDIFIYA